MDISGIKDFIELYEKVKGTPFEILIPIIVIAAVVYFMYKWVIAPVYKNLCMLIAYIQKKQFAKTLS